MNWWCEIVKSSIGAFCGAAFAFLFFVLAEFFKSIHARQVKHWDALGRLEYMLNDQMDVLYKNMCIAEGIIVSAGSAITGQQSKIIFDRLHPTPVDKDVLRDLANADLASDLYSYFTRLNSMNSDIAGVTRKYECFVDAFLGKSVDKASYLVNLKTFAIEITDIAKFTKEYLDRCIDFTAQVRVRLRNDRPMLRLLTPLCMSKKNENDFAELVAIEKQRLESEMKLVNNSSTEEIARVTQDM